MKWSVFLNVLFEGSIESKCSYQFIFLSEIITAMIEMYFILEKCPSCIKVNFINSFVTYKVKILMSFLLYFRLMTIRVIVSMKSVFLWKHHIYPISDKMVEVVENLNIGGHPIFVHCFSNGGSYLYHFFKEAVRNSKKPIIVRYMMI